MTEEKKVSINLWYDAYSKRTSEGSLSSISVFYDRFEKTPLEEIDEDRDRLLHLAKIGV